MLSLKTFSHKLDNSISKSNKASQHLLLFIVLSAQQSIQQIDMEAMERIGRIRDSFPNLAQPWLHPSAHPFHEEIKETLDACDVLLITGGHVAILRNRMFFFGCRKAWRGCGLEERPGSRSKIAHMANTHHNPARAIAFIRKARALVEHNFFSLLFE